MASDCVEWQGCRTRGYGTTRMSGKHQYVHRLIYRLYHDLDWSEMPPVIRHTCDNPACYNVEHLRGGTQKDNMRDCVNRGRSVVPNNAGVELAQEQQNALGVVDELLQHNEAVRDHIESLVAIKHYLCNDEYSLAYEAMAELPEEDKRALWRAPSKGGIFSTEERAQMKSNEWTAARMEHHGED